MKNEKNYGHAPLDLGFIDLNPTELMIWEKCPIKVPAGKIQYPKNLAQFSDIVSKVKSSNHADIWKNSYVYLTVRTTWQTPDNPGSRIGWHSDEFDTDDLTYIWSDQNPTIFFNDENLHRFSENDISIHEFCESQYEYWDWCKEKHLYLFDETVLHKVDTNITSDYRTVVKVTISDDVHVDPSYAINHHLKDFYFKKANQE